METPNRRVSGPLGTAPVGASTRAGLPVIAASPRGRDAQSIAFPSTPDTVPLYSGGYDQRVRRRHGARCVRRREQAGSMSVGWIVVIVVLLLAILLIVNGNLHFG